MNTPSFIHKFAIQMINEDEKKKQPPPIHQGFAQYEQELKYNATIFDLIITLATRVHASYKYSKCLL